MASAQTYLDMGGFSRSALIDQLVFEGFSKAEAKYAVDHIDANWNKGGRAERAELLRHGRVFAQRAHRPVGLRGLHTFSGRARREGGVLRPSTSARAVAPRSAVVRVLFVAIRAGSHLVPPGVLRGPHSGCEWPVPGSRSAAGAVKAQQGLPRRRLVSVIVERGCGKLVQTAPWGYVRLRLEQYSEADLAAWVAKLKDTQWREIYAYFMHEPTAPPYAQTLMQLW